MTGFDLEISSAGGTITAGTWTCPHCQDTLETTSTITVAVHETQCPEAPDPEQTGLEQFATTGGEQRAD